MPKLGKAKLALKAFLDAFKSHPCLWDTSHPDYSNRKAHHAARCEIQNILKVYKPKMTYSRVVCQISTWKRTFRTEFLKEQDAIAAGQTFKSSLSYYKFLDFLIGHVNLKPSAKDANETSINSDLNDNISQDGQDENKFDAACPSPNKTVDLSHDFKIEVQDPPEDRNNITEISNASCYPIAHCEAQVMAPEYYNQAGEDESMILAKGYATKLRKLSTEQLLFADKLINDALLNAQLGLLSRNSIIVQSDDSQNFNASNSNEFGNQRKKQKLC